MTAEAFTILVACALPTAALIAVAGLFVTVRALERSRDDLSELELRGR